MWTLYALVLVNRRQLNDTTIIVQLATPLYLGIPLVFQPDAVRRGDAFRRA